jgi:hypothetical protein
MYERRRPQCASRTTTLRGCATYEAPMLTLCCSCSVMSCGDAIAVSRARRHAQPARTGISNVRDACDMLRMTCSGLLLRVDAGKREGEQHRSHGSEYRCVVHAGRQTFHVHMPEEERPVDVEVERNDLKWRIAISALVQTQLCAARVAGEERKVDAARVRAGAWRNMGSGARLIDAFRLFRTLVARGSD